MELVITCLPVTVMRTLKEKIAVHLVSTLVFMCIGQIPHRFCKFWIMLEVQVTNRLPHLYVLNCGNLFGCITWFTIPYSHVTYTVHTNMCHGMLSIVAKRDGLFAPFSSLQPCLC